MYQLLHLIKKKKKKGRLYLHIFTSVGAQKIPIDNIIVYENLMHLLPIHRRHYFATTPPININYKSI